MRCGALTAMGLVLITSCTPVVKFTLDTGSVPVSNVETHIFKKGEPRIHDTGFEGGTEAPADFQRVTGRWNDPAHIVYHKTGTYYGSAKNHGWSVEIYPRIPEKEPSADGGWNSDWQNAHFKERVRQGILEAKDGYSSGLAWTYYASPRVIPRFERKTFPWGTAAAFLVQYQNDNTNYVPCNGMLQYEVHGLTPDGRYVKARFGVTHPKLTEFGPEVRDHLDDSAMRKDKDYILVEKCPAGEFQPSLNEIDRFLGTLKIGPVK